VNLREEVPGQAVRVEILSAILWARSWLSRGKVDSAAWRW